MKRLLILALIAMVSIGTQLTSSATEPSAKKRSEQSQEKKKNPKESKEKSGKRKKSKKNASDTTAQKPTPAKGSIEAVIKPGARRMDGLFTVIEQKGKYYFLIPTSLMDKDMLMVNRISKAAADMRQGFFGYAGDPIGENMVRLRQSPDSTKLFIENISTREMPRDTTGDMYQAVLRSNLQPIVTAFEIKGRSKDKDSILVDATDFIGGDSKLAGFDSYFKLNMNIGSFQKDKSYIVDVNAYPENIEMKSIKSYIITPKSKGIGSSYKPSSMPATYEINSSLILLPEIPMQPRYFDPRVGYFTNNYIDYDKNPQGVKDIRMITRWRLEPKPQDLEAYKRGELVEPEKPIVFYIDPATPKKWIPYLIAGVNDWQVAFEQAGFKNAIIGKQAPTPEQDSTWSLEDARFSAIVYKPSNVANASGPHISDPRTGQILESHINWYHNVMELLRNWYLIQAAPSDAGARKMAFDDDLMGDLIRFVSSHEVGHTLGLRHNFISSAMTPVDSLRSASFLEKNRHTSSIMDYARFNYVAQPEDSIRRELLYPKIGDYDKWAIEWGYRRFAELKTPEEEADTLNQWVISELENPRLWFGTETNSNDPRSQNEDLGDNHMRSNELGIKNLKVVLAGIPEWTRTPNEGYDNLKEIYREIMTQFMRYNGHVTKWVGGIYETPKRVEQEGDVYAFVEKVKQKEAMAFLDRNLFTTPTWLIDEGIYAKTGGHNALQVIAAVQYNGLRSLITTRVLNNLIKAEAVQGRTNSYTVTDLFGDMNRSIWSELSTGRNPDLYRRGLQTIYVDRLISLLPKSGSAPTLSSEVPARVTYELRTLESRLKRASSSDPAVRAHYQYTAKKIGDTLDPK